MAVTTHIPTKLMKAQGQLTSAQAVNFNSDTFMGLWVHAGSGIPSLTSSGIQFVADITATNTEDTNIGARVTLSGVTWAFDGSGVAVDWSFSNIGYPQNASDDGLSRYFVIYDNTQGSGDATHPVVALIDPGQLISVVNASLTIQAPGSGGLISFTGGG